MDVNTFSGPSGRTERSFLIRLKTRFRHVGLGVFVSSSSRN